MKSAIVAAVIFGIAASVGGWMQDKPYRLHALYNPVDQAALDHRDSVYTNITWVVSKTDQSQQLRFFDRVEGGIEIQPAWPDYAELAKRDPRLSHLVPADGDFSGQTPGPTWPHDWLPNPGTLTNTRYICLFPIGVLMNQRLMAEANNDYRATKPKILIVGLGSGTGIGILAHHFPQAEITVVDIDGVVNDMVVDHYPLLRWLTTQKNDAGAPRLRLVTMDARQYIKFQAKREAQAHPFDLVILDAYTAGSTIPPHLMTREFYHEIANILDESGIFLANIIGSYTGEKNLVLGGALRSMCAAGLPHAYNFPILNHYRGETPTDFSNAEGRNNITIATRKPINPTGPEGNPAVWERLRNFVVYPELPAGKYVTRALYLNDESGQTRRTVTSTVDASLIEKADATLLQRFTSKPDESKAPHMTYLSCQDPAAVERIAKIVLGDSALGPAARKTGWDSHANLAIIRRMDWVLHARDVFTGSIAAARDQEQHGARALVGPPEGQQREEQRRSALGANWKIVDAPLFTDAKPNADIYNR